MEKYLDFEKGILIHCLRDCAPCCGDACKVDVPALGVAGAIISGVLQDVAQPWLRTPLFLHVLARRRTTGTQKMCESAHRRCASQRTDVASTTPTFRDQLIGSWCVFPVKRGGGRDITTTQQQSISQPDHYPLTARSQPAHSPLTARSLPARCPLTALPQAPQLYPLRTRKHATK